MPVANYPKTNTNNVYPRYKQVITLEEALTIFYGNQSKLSEALCINRGTIRKYLNSDKEYYVFWDKTVATGAVTLEFINRV